MSMPREGLRAQTSSQRRSIANSKALFKSRKTDLRPGHDPDADDYSPAPTPKPTPAEAAKLARQRRRQELAMEMTLEAVPAFDDLVDVDEDEDEDDTDAAEAEYFAHMYGSVPTHPDNTEPDYAWLETACRGRKAMSVPGWVQVVGERLAEKGEKATGNIILVLSWLAERDDPGTYDVDDSEGGYSLLGDQDHAAFDGFWWTETVPTWVSRCTGLSPSQVRHALLRLIAAGLVRRQPHDGSYGARTPFTRIVWPAVYGIVEAGQS